MRTTKLTLSADRELIQQAKKLAAREGTSLSSMFSRFLRDVLSARGSKGRVGPITRKATGLARIPAGKNYKDLLTEALLEKHGL